MKVSVAPSRVYLPSLHPVKTTKRKSVVRHGPVFQSEFSVAPSSQNAVLGRTGYSAPFVSFERSHSTSRKTSMVAAQVPETPPKSGLPKYDSPEMLIHERYTGPTDESNWLIPGHLMIGAYPADTDDLATENSLISIMKLGIGVFVSLQEEYDPSPDVTEQMWRMGLKIRPYFRDVQRYYQCPIYWREVKRPDLIDFIHFPIRDLSASASDHDLFELCKALLNRLEDGQKLYVHCWGGHGRAGTVACILLAMAYGLSSEAALVRVQQAHDLRRQHLGVASPQTVAQRAQVRRIIDSPEVKEFVQERSRRQLQTDQRKENSDSPQSILQGALPSSSARKPSSSSASSSPAKAVHPPETPSPAHPLNLHVEIPTPTAVSPQRATVSSSSSAESPSSPPRPVPPPFSSISSPFPPSAITPNATPKRPASRFASLNEPVTPYTPIYPIPSSSSTSSSASYAQRSPLTARTTRQRQITSIPSAAPSFSLNTPRPPMAAPPPTPPAQRAFRPTPQPPRTARVLSQGVGSRKSGFGGGSPISHQVAASNASSSARRNPLAHANSVTPAETISPALRRPRYSQRNSVSPAAMRVLSP